MPLPRVGVAFAFTLAASAGCLVGEDEALDGTPGASVNSASLQLTGCRGQASSTIPADGRYVLTTFGGPGDHQPMSCGGYADGTRWYAASRQRYGCGAKLMLEANGTCVVVEAEDYGPDVCVERAANMPVMDVSPLVARELFGEAGLGYSDHEVVTVTEVAAAMPVGPCSSGPMPMMDSTCVSETLDREVTEGTCVQSAADGEWYECSSGDWRARGSSSGCADAYGDCDSATLDRAVPARTCVQAASNGRWYQCNGQGWVSPVDAATGTGPIGACSEMYAL